MNDRLNLLHESIPVGCVPPAHPLYVLQLPATKCQHQQGGEGSPQMTLSASSHLLQAERLSVSVLVDPGGARASNFFIFVQFSAKK